MQYSDYQQMASSEKITLAIVAASKRLMGWSLHSGSIYKVTGFSFAVIASIADSGTAYSEVSGLGSVVAGTFYLDRAAQTLYLRTTGSDNPNGRFIVLTVNLNYANVPITLPHDLASGFEVSWEPMIKSTSQFGVEIDTINQVSEAIEGSGTLTLVNDQNFWPAYFDKLVFENKPVRIWSYYRNLDPSDAKLIFSGTIEKKSYTSQTIELSLKDEMSVLKTPLSLGTIADLNERTGDDLAQARQRMLLGRIFGHRPVNIDQVLDGYPITGTVSISFNSATMTGTGTQFLTELSPDDRMVLNGVEYTVATVTSNTAATLTENYSDPSGLSGASVTMIPDQPKRWMNRRWHIAGHALREPVTTVANGSSISTLFVDDGEDLYEDDWIYVGTLGSGELVQIESKSGTGVLFLRQSLATIPPIGTQVIRPAVQNVRIDDVSLVYYQDYTLDASTATLTLRNTAESSASPIRTLISNLSFTNGSRTVTGTGLKAIIKPGYMIGVSGNSVFFEVLSVDTDTQITLRTAATFTASAIGRYKALILDPSKSVVSLDVLGRTDDDTTSGALMKTAPSIVKGLLTDLGLASKIDTASFTEAEASAFMHLGVVFPTGYSDSDTPTYRDMINEVNKSVFGTLIQNNEFQLTYYMIQPRKITSAKRFDESDLLTIKYDSTAVNMVKTAIVEWGQREYDYLTGSSSLKTSQKTSDVSTYLVGTTLTQTFTSRLVTQADAELIAARWAFILESSAGKITITTKLQAIDLGVGDVIQISHRKIFERYGSNTLTRLFLVQSVKKDGASVEIEAVDLSNAFNRVAAWNSYTADRSSASDTELLFGGYWTDDYGLIDNNADSYGTNLYW
jgi:hypothetical protein